MEIVPKERKKTFEKGLAHLEKAVIDPELRKSLESLIESYSKLDKVELWSKQSYLLESLARLCGKAGTEVIINILNKGSSAGAWKLSESIESKEVKKFLEEIVLKYGAQYQWLWDPNPNDWQRYAFYTHYLGVPPLPVISCRIITKSGKLLELESPLPSYGQLIAAQIGQLKNIDEEMTKLGNPKIVQKVMGKDLLKKIKRIVDELLEEEPKDNS